MAPTPSTFYRERLQHVHEELVSNSLAQQYLGGSDYRLSTPAEGHVEPGASVALPFGELEPSAFAHLFAIYEGSRVHAQREEPKFAPEGYYFTVINSQVLQYKNKIGVVKLEDESTGLHLPPQLYIDQFFLCGDAPELLGTLSFGLCAITAHLYGLSFIELVASGGVGFHPKQIGYSFWPKLGFDSTVDLDELPPALSSCNTVLDVLEKDAKWWDCNGSQRLMSFDLTADSRSWQKLLFYLHSKGLLT